MALRSQSRVDWIILILGMTIFFVASLIFNLEKGLAFGATAFVFSTVIQTKYEKRPESLKESRFWYVIGIMLFIHIMTLLIIDIPEIEYGLMALPFAIADGFVIWFLIGLVESNGRSLEEK